MSGNSFGQLFQLTSFGESHGLAIGGIVDGCPPGLALSEADLQLELDRRKPGTSRYTSQRRETDEVKILSGVFEGKTLGTPIAFMVENHAQKEKDYTDIKDKFRPGHADYTYQAKYGIRDYRGGGRSSARETVARVAAGAIAKKYLREHFQTHIRACLVQMGDIECAINDWDAVSQNPFFSSDTTKFTELENKIASLREQGDSIGAKIYCEALSVPAGLGEPVFAKLDAEIASAMMGINAVKAVEIGAGFDCITQLGSEHRDEITPEGFLSNYAGGTLGGISSGQAISLNVAVKPAASIRVPGQTIDTQSNGTTIETKGRHDPCVGIRAVPIVEAMLALVLMDHVMRQRAQNENWGR